MPSMLRCFNEAAGIPRGRLIGSPMGRSRGNGFNEAAGIPRGRHDLQEMMGQAAKRFNEAAGIPRGRPPPPPCETLGIYL